MDKVGELEIDNEESIDKEESAETKISPAELKLNTPKKIALTQSIQMLLNRVIGATAKNQKDSNKNSWILKIHQVIKRYAKYPYEEEAEYIKLNKEYLEENEPKK